MSQSVSASRLIPADAASIFEVLANPDLHPCFDGSNTVKKRRGSDSVSLRLGSTFTMNMRLVVPYVMKNKVVEFEQDRLIAWSPVGGGIWRYTLTPTPEGTLVTETFDWSRYRGRRIVDALGVTRHYLKSMVASLRNIEDYLDE